MENNKLTDRQQRFIEEYLIDLSAKQACIRAGYSPKSAEFQGSKLLAMSKVSQEIAKRQKEISKEMNLKREDIINRLNNRSKLVDEMHELASKSKLTNEEESRLSRLMLVIKTSDGNNADVILSKMLGFNEPDKQEITQFFKGLTINYVKPKDDK